MTRIADRLILSEGVVIAVLEQGSAMARGAETGSGFQETINLTNLAYERAGKAFITRKSIPGKYMLSKGDSRRGLSLPLDPGLSGDRLAAGSIPKLIREHRSTDWRRFIPEAKAEPDYGGVLAPDGRGIFYDAKTTRREALDFDNLHAHQSEFLERMAGCGAVAGFLVEFSAHRQVYFLPIQVLVRWRAESSRKSLPFKFFTDRLTPAPSGKGTIVFDYLTAIEAQENLHGRDFSRLII